MKTFIIVVFHILTLGLFLVPHLLLAGIIRLSRSPKR